MDELQLFDKQYPVSNTLTTKQILPLLNRSLISSPRFVAFSTSGWDKPWAVTYANTSSFALYLVPFALALGNRRSSQRRRGQRTTSHENFWAKHGFSLPDFSPPSSQGYSPIPAEDDLEEAHSRSEAAASRDDVTSTNASEIRPSPLLTSRTTRLRPVSPDAYRPRLVQGGRPSSIDGRRPIARLVDTSESASNFGNDSLVSLTPSATHHTAAATSNGHMPSALPPLTLRETAVLAAQFTLVWFAANWSLNAGLGMTSVASGTTLSSASGFFTLALGSFTGVERFSKLKLLATAISFVGVVLVTHADAALPDPSAEQSTGSLWRRDAALGVSTSAPINAPLGDALSLLSAFCYALYVTLLKLRIQSEDRVSMPLFFGFVGAFNIALLWPMGFVLHFSGIEPFEFPRDRATWIGVAINMSITFVSDFAYLLSMLKTAPLVATVGLSLTIPLAVAIDLVKGTHSGGMAANIGSLAVLLSFVAIGWDDNQAAEEDPLVSVGGHTADTGVARGRRQSRGQDDREDAEGNDSGYTHSLTSTASRT